MLLTNKAEADPILGLSLSDEEAWPIAKSYVLPDKAAVMTMLAKGLSALVLQENESWLEITYWHNDLEANQDLFYGYRRGQGDTRSLAEASIYKCAQADAGALSSILSLVLYFNWDARLLDHNRTYKIRISHDGFIDLHSTSEQFAKDAESEFELAGLIR